MADQFNYPSPYTVGPSTPAMTSVEATKKAVQMQGEIYDVAANAADAAQFANAGAAFFAKLKNPNSQTGLGISAGFANDLEYLQAAVRNAKGTAFYSTGTSNVGDISLEDYNAIKNLLTQSYIRGEYWTTTVQKDLTSPFRTTGGTFSKDITTALNLLDYSDAESRFNDAHFRAFGIYPSPEKIKNFQESFNTEAKKQIGKTTTTSTGGAGGVGTRKTVSSAEGFTQKEQDQFLASYLKDNYQITGDEKSGQVKSVIEGIKGAYKNNLLPEESMESIIAFAADLVGTADQEVANQKFATKLEDIRKASSVLNPGIKEILDSGKDASTIINPIIQKITNKLGVQLDQTDSRIAKIINYNDGKATRVMNDVELDNFLEQQPEFQTSPAGINKYLNIGRALKGALG